MERLFKWTAKMSAWVLLLVLIPFVMSYLLGMILPTSDYWLLTKICRVVVLALIVVVPMLVQHWRENQRFFLSKISSCSARVLGEPQAFLRITNEYI